MTLRVSHVSFDNTVTTSQNAGPCEVVVVGVVVGVVVAPADAVKLTPAAAGLSDT